MFINLATFTALAMLCLYLSFRCYRLKCALEAPLRLCELAMRSVDAYIVLIKPDFTVVKTNYYALNGTEAAREPKKLGNLLRCVNGERAGECGGHELCSSCPIRARIKESFLLKSEFSGLEEPLVIYKGDDHSKEVRCDVSLSGKYFTMDRQEYLMLTIYDLTRQKQIQQELNAARLRAEEADRMKSAFLANTTHEIRTPLNAILGFSDLLISDSDPEQRTIYIKIIRENNDKLLQLVNDIFDLSKIESGSLEFDYRDEELDVLMKELECIYRTKKTTGSVNVVYRREEPDRRIYTDRKRLAQVMMNFLTNALKFTPSGEIAFGYCSCGNDVRFYVKDSGIGISADNLDKVFDRFVKLNGSGIGLALCKAIVEQMGGRIGVESHEGKGSTFWFTLPALPIG